METTVENNHAVALAIVLLSAFVIMAAVCGGLTVAVFA